MVEKILAFWSFDFVRNALLAGSLAAVLGSALGYFVILRRLGFAAHALGHIGFTGATGAALLSLTPMQGMLAIGAAAGAAMGLSGNRLNRSELAIGMVLSMALGAGTLFLALYKGFAGQASAILFGNIFGVSPAQVSQTFWLALGALIALAAISRRLLFSSVQPDLAEARGISPTILSTVFLVLLAVGVTLASQVVGILLVFTLVIGPAGIAVRLMPGFWSAQAAAAALGLFAVWAGIFLSCLTNLPPSFWITLILFLAYLGAETVARFYLQNER